MKFENKKAFITGASRGIGKGIALELAQNGADILLHYRKNQEAANETKKEIEAMGRKVWMYAADLSSSKERDNVLLAIKKDHPSLDIYIANAASTAFKPLTQLDEHHIDKTLNLVVKNFILSVKALTPLLQNRNAHIVTISGIDTVKTFPGHGLLAAAKASLEMLTKYFATELAPFKIHVNSINPGIVDTDSVRFYLGEAFDEISKSIDQLAPQKGVGSVKDVARIVSFLCSDEANWITGQTIYADGGIAAMLPISSK